MSEIEPYLPALARGAWTSILIGAACLVVLVLVALALTLANRSPWKFLQRLSFVITEFMRGNSAIVLLFWVFYAVPLLPGGFQPSGVASAVVVLGVAGGAYASEGVRGAIRTVPRGQFDACEALGIGFWRRECRIVFPQAMPMIVSGLSTMSVEVFKWTAAVSLVTVQDVVYWVQTIRSQVGHTLILYVGLVVGFYLLSIVIRLIYRAAGAALTPRSVRPAGYRRTRTDMAAEDVGLALYLPRGGSR